MIELVQAPAVNRVVADGNDTLIKLRTNLGPEYYIKATIYINNVKFLTQGWSKDDLGNCAFNLKHLYYAYFSNIFTEEITTGFNERPGLFKKVKIVVEEFPVGGINAVSSLTLPEFSIFKNLKPQIFSDAVSIAFLDLPQENISAKKTEGFVFPLFIKAGSLLTVSILNELQQVLYTEVLENYTTQITQYEFLFETLGANLDGLDAIFIKFTTSQETVQKKIVFIDQSIYSPKQIFYMNNCGFYITAFLTGKKQDEHDLDAKSYAQFDGTEITYDVEDTKKVEISSGYGYRDITSLIHAIASSVDVRINFETYWERVKSETKKVQKFEDNKFVYGDSLKFSRINIANFTNENAYAILPEVEDITKTGDENVTITITKQEFLNAYAGTQSANRLVIRTLPENAKLSYEDANGVYNLSDMAANDPLIMPFTIPLDTFISLKYAPNFTEFGAPLDTIIFQMGPNVLLSNDASLILNITDVPDANLPPKITVNSIQEVALDGSGNGTKLIAATIIDLEGDPVSILWEALNGAPITFDDASLEDPTITITGGVANQSYQVKVTATDTANNLSSEKIISINTSSYKVSISAFPSSPGTATNIVYDVNIAGGENGKKVTLKFSQQAVNNFEMYSVIHLGEPLERILVGAGSTFIEELTFDAADPKTFQVELNNEDLNSQIHVTIRIESVEANQIIDTTKQSQTISL